eukprot:4888961-Amphidinium_carterae.1
MGLASPWKDDGSEWRCPSVEAVPLADATWATYEAPDGQLRTDSGVRIDATFSITRKRARRRSSWRPKRYADMLRLDWRGSCREAGHYFQDGLIPIRLSVGFALHRALRLSSQWQE